MSAEARRQGRRDQLIAGVLDVVGTLGVSGVTVDAVCGRAGLTKRYFYESFTNLDAALVAAMDAAFVDLRDRVRAAVDTPHPPAMRARKIAEILIDALATDPRVTRLYVEAPGHAALRARRDVAIAEFTTLLQAGTQLRKPSQTAADRQLLATRLVVAGTTDLVTGWLSGVIPADRDAIIDTIVAAAAGISASA